MNDKYVFLTAVTCMQLFACGDGLTGAESPPLGGTSTTTAALRPCPRPDERYLPVIASIEKERAALGAPGVAVAIMEHGRLTFAKGFGTKHPNRDDPVLPTTLFRIGSVTKMLTAAGLLQLVEEGKVDLDAPVTQYIPEFRLARDPTWAPSIRVRHLLTHSSGLFDTLGLAGPDQDDSLLFEYLTGPEFAQSEYLMSPPGRMYNYSNPNFMLAGLITERVSGTYYREYMRENVFAPLGMSRTLFLGKEVEADGDYAWGKTRGAPNEPGELNLVGPGTYDSAWGRPAGFAWSSVVDLAKFAHFLMHGDPSVLPNRLRWSMEAPQINTEAYLNLSYYGYGLAVSAGTIVENRLFPVYIVEHGGAIYGYSAEIVTLPAQGFAFITLANADGAYFDESLLTAARTLADLPHPLPAPDVGVNPSTFGMYAGTYEDPYTAGTFEVSTDGKDLYATVPVLDQGQVGYEHRLDCYVRHNCLFTIHGEGGDQQLPVTFILDPAGKVEYLRTRQFVAKKIENPSEDEPDRARAAATTSVRDRPTARALATPSQWDPTEFRRAVRRSNLERPRAERR